MCVAFNIFTTILLILKKSHYPSMICLFFVLVVACVALVESGDANNWPIIGLFTQPTTSTAGNCNGKCVYVAASYVKHLESAGARVVPIDYYSSTEELDKLFSSVNGFFFPGGSSSFPSSAQYIYDKVVAANAQGDFIPLWGVCMGFQWLLIAQSKDANILDPPSGQMDSYNISMQLDFTTNATSSKLFSVAPDSLMKIYATQNVTMNNHHYGIYPEHFYATGALSSFFNVLSTNEDRQGVEFVSTMESFDYPIFGTQWHPEKNNFEYVYFLNPISLT
jgi:gamma-glutamyl hydrolase